MAHSYILPVEGNDVAGYLELIRRILDPFSTSMPHVTVRYSSKPPMRDALAEYRQLTVESMYLVDATTFDAKPTRRGGGVSTVILRCQSDALESMSYKPDYPDSVFHITLYEGPGSRLAAHALGRLQSLSWHLNLELPPTKLQDRRRKVHVGTDGVYLSAEGRRALVQIFGPRTSPQELISLPDDERLSAIDRAASRIHSSSAVTPGERIRKPRTTFKMNATGVQGTLLNDVEISALRGSGIHARRRALKPSGSFLTPPELARDIVNEQLRIFPDDQRIRFGDPAIGGGIFFARLLSAVALDRLESAAGIERNALRAKMTADRWNRTKLEVIRADFLSRNPAEAQWNFLTANPPYVRARDLDAHAISSVRDALSSRLGLHIDGKTDLYVYFVLHAHAWLTDDGVAAWLLPSEFLSADYASALRSYLLRHVDLLRVHSYGSDESSFSNARVSSTAVIYRKRKGVQPSRVAFSRGGSLNEPQEILHLDTEMLDPFRKWSWPNISSLQSSVADSGFLTLDDLFYVKRGIATGANDVFVIDDRRMRDLAVPGEWVKPVLPKSRKLASNHITSDGCGNPLLEEPRWLIDSDASLDEISRRSPLLGQYLSEAQAAIGDRALVRIRKPFYRQEQRPRTPFLFVYMAKQERDGRPSRFILNDSRAVYLNNYVGLIPKPHLQEWLEVSPSRYRLLLSALESIPQEELDLHGRMYVSGLVKLEPKDLRAVRLHVGSLAELGGKVR